jgi:hypothetical protein
MVAGRRAFAQTGTTSSWLSRVPGYPWVLSEPTCFESRQHVLTVGKKLSRGRRAGPIALPAPFVPGVRVPIVERHPGAMEQGAVKLEARRLPLGSFQGSGRARDPGGGQHRPRQLPSSKDGQFHAQLEEIAGSRIG